MRHIWIDTDTGVDDAFALMAAVYLDKKKLLKLEGVSSVCGNVEHEKTFENARNVLCLAGREDIPVYPGAETPLVIPLETAAYVHGENGIGDVYIPASPAPRETRKAWDAIYECAVKLSGELELILVGPETNAALALEAHPDLPTYLKRILVMGGAKEGGNTTKDAEFNIYVDPHAAARVFSCPVPIVMCGLDVTMKAGLRPAEISQIEKDRAVSRGCAFFADSTKVARRLYEQKGYPGFYMHDSCPVLYSVFPDMFETLACQVTVETQDPETIGKTIAKEAEKKSAANALVVTGIDRERFKKLMLDVLETTGRADI